MYSSKLPTMTTNRNDYIDKTYLTLGDQIIMIDLDQILSSILFGDSLKPIPPPNQTIKEGHDPDKNKSKRKGNNIDYDEDIGLSINITKWEVVNKLIDVILSEVSEQDDKLGMKSLDKTSLSFKIAYNTLLKNNIIKIIDNE